jgi:hypothetical protein
MRWEDARRVRYSEFESSVQQHDPLELLPTVADLSSRLPEFEGFAKTWGTLAPWDLAGIARSSILTSNRSRSKAVTENRLRRLRNLFELIETTPQDDFKMVPFLLGKAYEQSQYQLSAKEDLIRGVILMLETDIKYPNAKSAGDWTPILNAPFEDVALSTLSVYAVVRDKGGVFNREWVQQSYEANIHGLAPVTSVMGTLDRLTATIEEARQDGLAAAQLRGGLRKYGYNPLVKTPLIELGNGNVCAPQSSLVLRSFSPENLYYLGWKQWPKDFGREFGDRVEAYTGNQLNHTGQLEVLPEIRWGRSGNLSVDWFLILPSATILIECKSARTTLDARAGDTTAVGAISAKLRRGYEQINESVTQIMSGNSKFSALPRDRPMIGLVVTAEPCYLANTDDIRDRLPATEIPVLTVSLREIEHLSSLPGDVIGDALLKVVNDPVLFTYDLYTSIKDVVGEESFGQRNQLIDDAYLKYVMPEKMFPGTREPDNPNPGFR